MDQAQPRPLLVLFGGMATMMLVMGIGRFVYTPILPDMIGAGLLDVKQAGLLASSNFLGYFLGALAATPFGRPMRRRLLIGFILVSIVTTAGMGLTRDLLLWHGLRFVSGIASAFGQIYISGFVMEALSRRGKPLWIGWLIGGVGLGVVVSSVVVELAQKNGVAWDWQWLAAGGLAALLAIPALTNAWSLRNGAAPVTAGAIAPPRERLFTFHFTLLFVAYAGLGIGYVVQATYLPTMVRALPQLASFSTLAWLVFGLAAAPSNIFWQFIAGRLGVPAALIVGFLLQATGLLAPVLWHSVPGVIIGAATLGSTLVGITALCLQQARAMAGEQFPRAIALMTAGFGLGQIAGPPIAALLVGPGNDFLLPTIMTSTVLTISALLCIPLLKRRRA